MFNQFDLNKWHKNQVDTGKYSSEHGAEDLVCADGFSMSVQASEGHYCTPKRNFAPCYSHFEVGYPSKYQSELTRYKQGRGKATESVYAYVPVEVLESLVYKHGGVKK